MDITQPQPTTERGDQMSSNEPVSVSTTVEVGGKTRTFTATADTDSDPYQAARRNVMAMRDSATRWLKSAPNASPSWLFMGRRRQSADAPVRVVTVVQVGEHRRVFTTSVRTDGDVHDVGRHNVQGVAASAWQWLWDIEQGKPLAQAEDTLADQGLLIR